MSLPEKKARILPLVEVSIFTGNLVMSVASNFLAAIFARTVGYSIAYSLVA